MRTLKDSIMTVSAPQLDPAELLTPGAAVILDTETTDLGGRVIEVAVIDAATGGTLIDTLVDPQGAPIHPDAAAKHHISVDELAGAPTFAQIWPELDRTCRGRIVLAWNAPFDQAEIAADCIREHLPAPTWTWGCLMRLDASIHHTRWQSLDGGHRALGDTLAARTRLLGLADTSTAA